MIARYFYLYFSWKFWFKCGHTYSFEEKSSFFGKNTLFSRYFELKNVPFPALTRKSVSFSSYKRVQNYNFYLNFQKTFLSNRSYRSRFIKIFVKMKTLKKPKLIPTRITSYEDYICSSHKIIIQTNSSSSQNEKFFLFF